MTTDSIGSRFGVLGSYGGTPLEDSDGPRRTAGSRGRSAPQSAELHVSSWLTRGPVSLAQGVQMGVAAAQAGLAAADGSRGSVPPAQADWLAFAPQATDIPQESGASLQVWLDIATGHMALQDAMQAASARVQPAVPQAAAQPREKVALGPPAETAPAAQPEAPELTRPPLESASPFPSPLPSPSPSPSALVSASASPPARPPAEQGARAALAEARRSFTTALERLDAQLEPALAAALSRLPGQDAAAAAQSAASRMRSQPERALETQRKTQLPGVLGLLRWDFTPLTEPLPDALPAKP